jgi:hypothetical protein
MSEQNVSMAARTGPRTKRSFLHSLAGVSLGSFALAGSSLADDDLGQDEKNEFVEKVRNSEQYGTVKDAVVDGGFLPQFQDTTVRHVEDSEAESSDSGTVAVIPTNNTQDDPAEVTLVAFEPDDDPEELELKVKTSYDGRPLGTLYTDSEVVQTPPRVTNTFPTTGSNYPTGPGLFSTHSTEVQPMDCWVEEFCPKPPDVTLPGFDDLRDAIDTIVEEGNSIIDGTAERFHDTAEYLRNEGADWAEEAYEYKEPIVEGVTPTPSRDPPEELVERMNDHNAEHVETIDLDRSCYLIGLSLSIRASVGVTLTGVGAGAGSLLVLGGGAVATIAACELKDLTRTFGSDLEDCKHRYVYVFEQKDRYGDTENWFLVFPCE